MTARMPPSATRPTTYSTPVAPRENTSVVLVAKPEREHAEESEVPDRDATPEMAGKGLEPLDRIFIALNVRDDHQRADDGADLGHRLDARQQSERRQLVDDVRGGGGQRDGAKIAQRGEPAEADFGDALGGARPSAMVDSPRANRRGTGVSSARSAPVDAPLICNSDRSILARTTTAPPDEDGLAASARQASCRWRRGRCGRPQLLRSARTGGPRSEGPIAARRIEPPP